MEEAAYWVLLVGFVIALSVWFVTRRGQKKIAAELAIIRAIREQQIARVLAGAPDRTTAFSANEKAAYTSHIAHLGIELKRLHWTSRIGTVVSFCSGVGLGNL